MIVGGYSLHLYCDLEKDGVKHAHDEFPHEFGGKNRTAATREARAAGWRVRHVSPRRMVEGRAVCPSCVGEGRR